MMSLVKMNTFVQPVSLATLKTNLLLYIFIYTQSNFCWGHPTLRALWDLGTQRRRLSAMWRRIFQPLTRGKVCDFPISAVCFTALWIHKQCRHHVVMGFVTLGRGSALKWFWLEQQQNYHSTAASCCLSVHSWELPIDIHESITHNDLFVLTTFA